MLFTHHTQKTIEPFISTALSVVKGRRAAGDNFKVLYVSFVCVVLHFLIQLGLLYIYQAFLGIVL